MSALGWIGRRRRAQPGESGAALVEFALVMPVLFLVLFALIEFGRAFNYWLDANHLANEGARWAVVNKNPGTPETLQRYIQQQADSGELKNGSGDAITCAASVAIEFPANPATATSGKVGDPVKVKVSAAYNWMPLIGNEIGVFTTTLVGSATMRLEALPTNYSPGTGGTGC